MNKKTYWTELEINTLKALIDQNKSILEISTIINRTPSAIRSIIYKINSGNYLPPCEKYIWTEKEKLKLVNLVNSGQFSISEAVSIFNKSQSNIYKQLKLLNIYDKIEFWTESRIEILKKLILEGKTYKEIGNILGVCDRTVCEQVKKRNIRPIKISDAWTQEEIDMLFLLAEKKTSAIDMSSIIHRGIGAIRAKSKKLGINLRYEFFSKEEELQIHDLLNKNMTMTDIAKYLQVNYIAVFKYCKRHGLQTHRQKIKLENSILLQENKRRCSKCDRVLTLDFFTNISYKNVCSECYQEIRINHQQDRTFIDRIDTKLNNAIKTAKKRGFGYDIDREYIILLWNQQNGRCFYSGQVMNHSYDHPNCFSIERKDSSLGYTRDNICLICSWLNIFKKDLHYESFINLCRQISNHTKDIHTTDSLIKIPKSSHLFKNFIN